MAETRTITIESPPKNILSLQVEGNLVDRFVLRATAKGGSWRSKNETFQHALESAVAVALTKFLEGCEERIDSLGTKLPNELGGD